MKMKMKQKNTGSRELKNLQLRSPIAIEDENDDDSSDMESPYYPPPPKDYVVPQKDHKEGYRRQKLKCSQAALDYYNKRNHTNYEIVEPMSSSEFRIFPLWVHLNFTAKPKPAPNDGDDYSSTKLFFGEVFHNLGDWVVTKCVIVKGKSGQCDYCKVDKPIKHPTRGFRMQRKFKPYGLRSQARGYTVG